MAKLALALSIASLLLVACAGTSSPLGAEVEAEAARAAKACHVSAEKLEETAYSVSKILTQHGLEERPITGEFVRLPAARALRFDPLALSVLERVHCHVSFVA